MKIDAVRCLRCVGWVWSLDPEIHNFTTGGRNDNISLWQPGGAGFDPSNPFRNTLANYFLPSEDEWYKAAYYDPNANGGAGGYWNYATGSNTAPTAVAGGTSPGTAVYGQGFQTGPADITNAGGLSPYGTMAQSGNVWNWVETGVSGTNDSTGEERVIRGGDWFDPADVLRSDFSDSLAPTTEVFVTGFRVAAVPEPSAFLLTVFGMIGAAMRRKR